MSTCISVVARTHLRTVLRSCEIEFDTVVQANGGAHGGHVVSRVRLSREKMVAARIGYHEIPLSIHGPLHDAIGTECGQVVGWACGPSGSCLCFGTSTWSLSTGDYFFVNAPLHSGKGDASMRAWKKKRCCAEWLDMTSRYGPRDWDGVGRHL